MFCEGVLNYSLSASSMTDGIGRAEKNLDLIRMNCYFLCVETNYFSSLYKLQRRKFKNDFRFLQEGTSFVLSTRYFICSRFYVVFVAFEETICLEWLKATRIRGGASSKRMWHGM